MSMKSEQEEFKQLRRLLALKRYEQPPPGYFNDFSQQVISQILAARPLGQDSAIEQLGWEAPWLQRLWMAFEAKPLLAGAFGVAVCALLISGVVYSERTVSDPVSGSIASLPLMPETPVQSVVLMNEAPPSHAPVVQPAAMGASSIDGFATPQGRLSLFQEIKGTPNALMVTPVSYPAGH